MTSALGRAQCTCPLFYSRRAPGQRTWSRGLCQCKRSLSPQESAGCRQGPPVRSLSLLWLCKATQGQMPAVTQTGRHQPSTSTCSQHRRWQPRDQPLAKANCAGAWPRSSSRASSLLHFNGHPISAATWTPAELGERLRGQTHWTRGGPHAGIRGVNAGTRISWGGGRGKSARESAAPRGAGGGVMARAGQRAFRTAGRRRWWRSWRPWGWRGAPRARRAGPCRWRRAGPRTPRRRAWPGGRS